MTTLLEVDQSPLRLLFAVTLFLTSFKSYFRLRADNPMRPHAASSVSGAIFARASIYATFLTLVNSFF